MITQNQLQSSEEMMVDVFEVEELESRLEMCGSDWNESSCPETGGGGGCSASTQTDPKTGKCYPTTGPANE
jgi:hypothetical protein